MNPVAPRHEAEDEEPEFKPLTPDQAREWRKRHPAQSVWRLVLGQLVVGALVTLLAWLITQDRAVAGSAAWGALCVVVPSALFARGMARARQSVGGVLMGLFVWEMAKIALTVAMLWMAVRWLQSPHWLALLVAMVVTMKTYWFVLLVRTSVRKTTD
ncbi:MAG: ATP synthase subunit I [Burkholderiaceae bacterium]|nr:ATP synthase subunit I [Burkholderiaceae bacterium]MCO5105066.1 ATP synthase subunit I [Burkholderiaceae bacterium]